MTNVNPSELNYDNYSEEKYDRDIVNAIPGHEEMHKKIEEIIKKDFNKKGVRVLELGIGTGLTAYRILRILDRPTYMGIDFSKNMLNHAKRKLEGFNLKFVLGDFAQMQLPKDIKLIVSVIGIHHQNTNMDKKAIFKKIFNSLASNGAFIFGDLVAWKDKKISALNDAYHYHHLVEKATDEETLKDWAYHHKYLNRLAPLEDQVEWLKEAGFSDVKVIYAKFNTTLVYAKK